MTVTPSPASKQLVIGTGDFVTARIFQRKKPYINERSILVGEVRLSIERTVTAAITYI
jgi:hypothetical protein